MENNPLWAELGKHWKLVALRGVAALVFGVLTLLSPALALTVLVLFWGAYALVDGAFALIAAFNMRSDGQFNWPLALVGVIGVAAGLVAFFWPQLTAIGLLLIIAGWALAMGIFQIVAAIRLRKSTTSSMPRRSARPAPPGAAPPPAGAATRRRSRRAGGRRG